jgi:carbon-monoxide dehydrogenase small subunit
MLIATTIQFQLNGLEFEREVPVNWTLLRLLRDGLGYNGTKCGCEIGECGSCTVLYNGRAMNSCLILAPQIDSANIWTIEGVAPDGRNLHPIQKAFLEYDAVHCGFCSSGMVMSAIALFLKNRTPNNDEIKRALAGNLCRCTGYIQIIDAVKAAAKNVSDSDLDKFRQKNKMVLS